VGIKWEMEFLEKMECRDTFTVVWAVKKNVPEDTNKDNESKIYMKEAYGKSKIKMVQSAIET
jgi:hypothetical protein